MKILHILRSQPNNKTQSLINEISKDDETRQVKLYNGNIDYSGLIKELFNSHWVISWW